MSRINYRLLFGGRKEAKPKDRGISAVFIIWWRMSTAGAVAEKVRINQSSTLSQPAVDCILTQCNGFQTSGLDACWQHSGDEKLVWRRVCAAVVWLLSCSSVVHFILSLSFQNFSHKLCRCKRVSVNNIMYFNYKINKNIISYWRQM